MKIEEFMEKYKKEGFEWVYLEPPICSFGLVMTENEIKKRCQNEG